MVKSLLPTQLLVSGAAERLPFPNARHRLAWASAGKAIACFAFIFCILNTPDAFAQHQWATKMPGVDNQRHYTESMSKLEADAAGNIFVIGRERNSFSEPFNFFLAKINGTSGNQVWSAIYSNPGGVDNVPISLALDNAGNAFVTGYSFTIGPDASSSIITIKYNGATGAQEWVAVYSQANANSPTAITIDAQGNVLVTGVTFEQGDVSRSDYVTIKYNGNSGTELWASIYDGGAESKDNAKDVATDAAGNVYVTGYSEGSSFNDDFLTVKYNGVTGAEEWVRRYNGPHNGSANFDQALGIETDAAGNVVVAGMSEGLSVSVDLLAIKYNSAGNLLWLARYNAPGDEWDFFGGMALDGSGNVYVTGDSPRSGSARDYVTVKFSSGSGLKLWEAWYAGPGNDSDLTYCIVTDAAGDVYVTGDSGPSIDEKDIATVKYNGITGVQEWVQRYAGNTAPSVQHGFDLAVDNMGGIFVLGHDYEDPYGTVALKYAHCINSDLEVTPQPAAICAGQSINLTASGASTYSWSTGAQTPVITVSPTSTTTYSVGGINAQGCYGVETSTVVVNPTPAAPTATGNTVCGSGSMQLQASGAAGYRWYANPTGGSAIATGATFTTPVLNTTTSYYVAAVLGVCESSTRTEAEAKVEPLPPAAITAGGPVAFCPGGSVLLSAPAGAYTYAWEKDGSPAGTSQTLAATSSGSYTVTVTSTAAPFCSAASTPVQVNADDNTPPVAAAQNVTIYLDANGQATLTVAAVDNGSSDACGIASLSLSQTNFTCANVGENTVTLTVTDANDNSSFANAIITVEDNVPPVAAAQNVTIQLDASGNASVTAQEVNNGSADACGIATMSLSQTAFTCANLGENTVTLTVTDNNSNTNTALATVTVADNILPTITCGSNISVTAQPNDCTPIVTWTEPAAADNCSYTVTNTHNSGDQFPVGTTTVVYSVEDAAGNKANCSFTVTVTPTPLVITSLSSPTFAGGFNISCNGGNNGSATAAVNGGCLPYNYAWSNGQNSATATGLTAGTYTVTVTDANGTSTQQSITLTEPTDLTMTGTLAPEYAHAGAQPNTIYLGYGPQSRTLTATAAGGVAGYSYGWSPVTGLNAATGASVIASPTVTTSYTVTATDANGCTETLVHEVVVIDAQCGANPNNPKVLVCHNGQELCISGNAVLAHLNHGCTVGPCGSVRTMEQPEVTTPEVTAYPNPNNGRFTVEVKTVADGQVVLDLYDISGRSIRQLFAGSLEKGERRMLAVEGPALPNGIYLIRMLTEGRVTTLCVAVHP